MAPVGLNIAAKGGDFMDDPARNDSDSAMIKPCGNGLKTRIACDVYSLLRQSIGC